MTFAPLSRTLLASSAFAEALETLGRTGHFPSGSVLFGAGDPNSGVFIIGSGTVRLRVPERRRLDRLFSIGSVLGLPSTFNTKPYSLTATCLTDCEITEVAREDFLRLMKARLDLCSEATGLLAAELEFIFSALRKRARKKIAKSRPRLCLH